MFYPTATQLVVEKKSSLYHCAHPTEMKVPYPKFGSDVDPDDTIQHLEGM